MNCPVCNIDMIEGYILTASIEWIPKYNNPHLVYKSDKSNGFRQIKHIRESDLKLSKSSILYFGGEEMECPFCHANMNKGTINASGPVGMFWLKEGDKISAVSILTKELIEDKHDGVVLAGPAYFKASSLVAYICQDCRKTIVEY